MNPHDIGTHDVGTHDPSTRIDRHIDLALRREPDAGPPADFARSVAVLARERAADPAIERWLVRALVAVFGLAAVVVTVVYGREWLPAFGSVPVPVDASTLNWVAAMLACIALTWLMGRAGQPRTAR